MRRLLPKPQANDYEVEISNPFSRTKNIQVSEDSERGLAILKIYGSIDEPEEYIEQLSKLDELSKKFDVIEITLNSPGGNYDELVAIYDMMQLLDADIRTIVMGSAMSAGALLGISGTCGQRFITPTSRLMFHAVSMGIEGKAQDIKIDYKESERLNRQIADLIKNHSQVTDEEVERFCDRDIYVLPDEAVKLGMFDAVITGIQ